MHDLGFDFGESSNFGNGGNDAIWPADGRTELETWMAFGSNVPDLKDCEGAGIPLPYLEAMFRRRGELKSV